MHLLQVQQYFPRDGSRATPPHPASNFKWKDYCPKAFNKLRATFHIDPADYMLSICGAPCCRPWHTCCCVREVVQWYMADLSRTAQHLAWCRPRHALA